MRQYPDTLEETVEWFKRAVPEPTKENIGVQLGCHFEEVAEMLSNLHGYNSTMTNYILKAYHAVKELSNALKEAPANVVYPEEKRVPLLDDLTDQVVTAAGAAYMMDMDIVGALEEVNRSNFSKFVKGHPVFTEQGKIDKGPNFTKPNLTKYIVRKK